MTRSATDAGQAPIELALGAGLLILPVTLLVLSFATWVERQSLAYAAARETARVVVLADGPETGLGAAEVRVEEMALNHGLVADDIDVCFSVHPIGSAAPDACTGLSEMPRGAAVTAYVAVRLPSLTLPGLPTELTERTFVATHTERVDRYRSW